MYLSIWIFYRYFYFVCVAFGRNLYINAANNTSKLANKLPFQHILKSIRFQLNVFSTNFHANEKLNKSQTDDQHP